MEVEKGEEEMRSNRYNKKTYDFSGQKYSPELIRKYEDPEYAKAADQDVYKRQLPALSLVLHTALSEAMSDWFQNNRTTFRLSLIHI